MAARKTSRPGKRRKPTFSSVTTIACSCNYLERCADEPENPIIFDATMNEYHILNRGKNRGYTMIYHCHWCGGAAPQSKRAKFFATIPQKEQDRLLRLTRGLTTIDAASAKLGTPDSDMVDGMGVKTYESENQPPTVNTYRQIEYTALSKTAIVSFVDLGPNGGVRASFRGKSLSRPKR